MVNLVLVCVFLSLGTQVSLKHSCFLWDKGLFYDRLIKQVGKVSAVPSEVVSQLRAGFTARFTLNGFQTLHDCCVL